MQNHLKTIIQAAAIIFLLQACAHGPYRGRVIEEESGRPIAGAVAIGNWTDVHVNVAGGTTYCIDARETVTDANGEFEIPDVSRGNFSIFVYKVGYRRVQCLWESLMRWGGCMTEPAEWDGDRAIILFERVAKSKLNSEIGEPPHISCGRKDGKPLSEYIKVHKEYRKALGLKP
jgi:hypothetical protein